MRSSLGKCWNGVVTRWRQRSLDFPGSSCSQAFCAMGLSSVSVWRGRVRIKLIGSACFGTLRVDRVKQFSHFKRTPPLPRKPSRANRTSDKLKRGVVFTPSSITQVYYPLQYCMGNYELVTKKRGVHGHRCSIRRDLMSNTPNYKQVHQ